MVSRIGGAGFDDFQQDLLNLSKRAWLARKPLAQGGLLKFVHGGEYHAYNPDVVQTLQKAVQSGEYSDYQQYAKLVNERPAATLRDLLALNPGEDAISIDDVEPAKELFKRFDTAAMSIGALSPEAHESLAEAMNSIGGFSNSGEGGEDPARYGTNKVSRIKQSRPAASASRQPIWSMPTSSRSKSPRGRNRVKAVSCRVIKSPRISPNCAIPYRA